MKPSAATIAKRSAAIRAKNDARIALMHADYMTGLSLKEVGTRHGLHESSVWKFFQTRGLATRSGPGPAGFAKGGRTHRARLDALVAEMHALYMTGQSLHAVGAKYGRDHGGLRELFTVRGLYVRPFKAIPRQANGSPVRYVPKTEAEIEALIAAARIVRVPAALRFEWRRWSMDRRVAFVAKLRAKLASPYDRPDRPFSPNVMPFAYGTPEAHAIADALNVGRNSRTKQAQLKPSAQGVIYAGALWYWTPDRYGSTGGAYYSGKWTPETARPQLHHRIWSECHGRPVPRGCIVRMIDGNPNNLDPANLRLVTRNELCRENQSAALQRKSRERVALLLDRSQQPQKEHDHLIQTLVTA